MLENINLDKLYNIYYMFPEKIIIDTISDYEISNPQTTKSDVSFDDVKYEMTIFDYMTRNVLLHVPTNTILHFGFHPSYYSYYQNDYFNKSTYPGASKGIHPSRWETLEEISRDFNIKELPNQDYIDIERNRRGKYSGNTIIFKGLFNILRFFIYNIDYCLENYSSTTVVFLNSVFAHYTDDDINNETWQMSTHTFTDLTRLVDTLRLRSHLRASRILIDYPYIKGLSQNVKYIKLNGDLHNLFTENIIVDEEMRRYLPPERLAEYKNPDTLYTLDDISHFISVGISNKYFRSKIEEYDSTMPYYKSTILINETFWWPHEHNSEFNINLMRLFRLLSLYLKENYSLYSSINELNTFVKRQPAEQRLAFAKNYNTRLQENDLVPFDVLDTIPNYELSNPNISRRIYSQNVDKLVRSTLQPRKTILDTYLDMLKDENLSKEDKTKTKRKIYNRLTRENKSHLYNDLVSPDIDPTMEDIYEPPFEPEPEPEPISDNKPVKKTKKKKRKKKKGKKKR